MLTSSFLKPSTAAGRETRYRSQLFNHRAAARAIAMTPAEPESISAMTVALIAVADLRTAACPDAPSISSTSIADGEPTVQVAEIITTTPAIVAIAPEEIVPAGVLLATPRKTKKPHKNGKTRGSAAVPGKRGSRAGSWPKKSSVLGTANLAASDGAHSQ
jgi:hypothetical protein